MLIFIIFKWGWGDSSITYKIKLRVTTAVCCQVVYDCGIKYTFSFSQLPVWKIQILQLNETLF